MEAGVSFVTVSRVFNDHPNVSAAMREKVFAAARTVGYSPKLVSRPKVIGILLADMTKLSGRTDKSALCTQISRAAAQRGYLVQYIPLQQIEVATQRLVDGIIEVDLMNEQIKTLETMPKAPVVLTQNRHEHPGWSSVTVDYIEEGKLAMGTLVGAKHQRIAVVLDNAAGWIAEERLQGMRDVLPSLADADVYDLSVSTSSQVVMELCKSDYTGVIAMASDHTSALVDGLINDQGKKIPEDLSLLVLDNSTYARHMHPRLSSLEQPLALIAEKAMDEMALLLEKKGKGRAIKLRSQLQVRTSCAECG